MENKDALSQEEKLKLQELKIAANEKNKEKKELYLKYLSLDSCSDKALFLEIDYAGKGTRGRTVLCLGEFAMHMRSAGHKKGKFWDEKLAINQEGEQSFDVLMVRLRHDVSGIDLTRRLMEEEEAMALVEGHDPKSRVICHLIIYFRSGGSYEINGLPEEYALHIRKVIYGWISHLY